METHRICEAQGTLREKFARRSDVKLQTRGRSRAWTWPPLVRMKTREIFF
jgi:hypothetical protein